MAISKLTLSFGLISIPVRIENLIGDGTKPKGNYVCATSHKPFAGSSGGGGTRYCGEKHDGPCKQTTGYKTSDGENPSYYVPDETTLATLAALKDKQITLSSRVPADEVDPAYFDKTYVLRPDNDANAVSKKAFWIFAEAIRDMEQVVVGQAVLDKDEKMLVLRWSKQFNTLLLSVGCFDEQIRREKLAEAESSRQGLPPATDAEKTMARQMLETFDVEPFTPEKYQPSRWHALNALIAEHTDTNIIVGGPAQQIATVKQPDLADLMQQSIDAAASAKPKKAATKKGKVKA